MTIHGCGMCGGIWLDNAASKVVVERMEPIALDLADSASSRAQHTVDKTETGIPCAVCGQAMQRTRVAQATVDVDICPEHGTWFDCDEMQRVMRSFDRARWSRSSVERPEQDIDEWARQVRGTDWKESDAVAILGGVAAALAAGAAVDTSGPRRR
jgi:Zn-finger nucleic acid-binding protein